MVLVSHQKEFIFLKTRKTAGTSFEMLLEPLCAPPGREVREKTPELVSDYGVVGARLSGSMKKHVWSNHLAAHRVAALLGPERFNGYARLTSVRNPFHRCVSQFYWQIYWKKRKPPTSMEEHRRLFAEYVLSRDFFSDRGIVELNGEFVIDDAFRIEHADIDIARISRRYGLDLPKGALPRTKDNRKLKPDFDIRELFTPRIERRIRKRQAWVFDHFDYPRSILDP